MRTSGAIATSFLLAALVTVPTTARGQEASRPATYTAARGETLEELARRFGVTVAALVKANPQIRDGARLLAGDRLVIPAGALGRPAGESSSLLRALGEGVRVFARDLLAVLAQRATPVGATPPSTPPFVPSRSAAPVVADVPFTDEPSLDEEPATLHESAPLHESAHAAPAEAHVPTTPPAPRPTAPKPRVVQPKRPAAPVRKPPVRKPPVPSASRKPSAASRSPVGLSGAVAATVLDNASDVGLRAIQAIKSGTLRNPNSPKDPTNWGRWCRALVRTAFRKATGRDLPELATGSTAWDSYRAFEREGLVHHGGTPPAGALVFWSPAERARMTKNPSSPGAKAGHIAISNGDGTVITNAKGGIRPAVAISRFGTPAGWVVVKK